MVVWSKQTISRMSLFFHQPVHFKIESTMYHTATEINSHVNYSAITTCFVLIATEVFIAVNLYCLIWKDESDEFSEWSTRKKAYFQCVPAIIFFVKWFVILINYVMSLYS
ncbi:hypothetical protein Pan54_45600 [Rubinisphaera italica]|uniref:Uncharacterized protein n=1 Tax=Rubinisphaera italica TaxID=2527969 RepID=A0A5C5XMU9_9PLAN|nr:hypothetical protein Pan54_45600 [Rubinisphaera italica]